MFGVSEKGLDEDKGQRNRMKREQSPRMQNGMSSRDRAQVWSETRGELPRFRLGDRRVQDVP